MHDSHVSHLFFLLLSLSPTLILSNNDYSLNLLCIKYNMYNYVLYFIGGETTYHRCLVYFYNFKSDSMICLYLQCTLHYSLDSTIVDSKLH